MAVRRSFLKNLLIGGVGVSIVPWKLLSGQVQTPRFTIIDLPEPTQHVRHGNWRPQKHINEGLPHWLGNYQHDVFFKNGMFSQADDLEVFSFKINGDKYDLTLQNKEAIIITSKRTLSISLSEGGHFNIVDNDNYFIDLLLINKSIKHKFSKGKEVVLFSLKGETKMDFGVINSQKAIFTEDNDSLSFVGDEKYTLCLIVGRNAVSNIL